MSVPTIKIEEENDSKRDSVFTLDTEPPLSPKSRKRRTTLAQLNDFTTMTPQEIAQWIDRRSRIVFPALFIIFNILYWSFIWI